MYLENYICSVCSKGVIVVTKPKVPKVNIGNFFEKGFESKEWKNVNDYDLPVSLKFIKSDLYSGRFGDTTRYFFEDKDGIEVRLLCKGNTFKEAIEKFVAIGDILELWKSEKGYWIFDKK
jgi:hypothetical protein